MTCKHTMMDWLDFDRGCYHPTGWIKVESYVYLTLDDDFILSVLKKEWGQEYVKIIWKGVKKDGLVYGECH